MTTNDNTPAGAGEHQSEAQQQKRESGGGSLKRLTGLWRQERQDGRVQLSGQITIGGMSLRVVILPNTKKQPNEKRKPDYTLCVELEEPKHPNEPPRGGEL